jgi:hypothetical protein
LSWPTGNAETSTAPCWAAWRRRRCVLRGTCGGNTRSTPRICGTPRSWCRAAYTGSMPATSRRCTLSTGRSLSARPKVGRQSACSASSAMKKRPHARGPITTYSSPGTGRQGTCLRCRLGLSEVEGRGRGSKCCTRCRLRGRSLGEMGSMIVSTPALPRYEIGDLIRAFRPPYLRCIGRDK